jgi:hypothetical protein
MWPGRRRRPSDGVPAGEPPGERGPRSGEPPRLLVAWEGLPTGAQIAIAFPVLVVLLFLLHVTLFNQPTGRGVFYGVFWAIPATAAIVIATSNEAEKRRRHRE